MYPIFLSNSGILDGYEVVNIKRGDVRTVADAVYKGETYLKNGFGNVVLEYFSPNKIIISADLYKPDTLILNQNYYTGWRVAVDGDRGRVISSKDLISADLDAGSHKVSFDYLPNSFVIGLAVSALAVMGLFFIRRFRKNDFN
jgi:uncharacterized membrane protein YfhO